MFLLMTLAGGSQVLVLTFECGQNIHFCMDTGLSFGVHISRH